MSDVTFARWRPAHIAIVNGDRMLTEEVTMATISSTARQIGLMIVLAVLFAMLLTKSHADSPFDQKRPCTGDALHICRSKIPNAMPKQTASEAI